MELEPLQKIGLTQGEIKVYLALLHLGTSTAGPIAKEAKVARSKIYDILNRLATKGVVSHSVKNGTKQFSVADPSRFLDFLRKKEENIKVQKKEIMKILPKLEQEYEFQKVKQEAEVFEGLDGLKNVRERYIKTMKQSKEPIYFFAVPTTALKSMEAYYKDWNKRRINLGIKSYTVMTYEAKKHPYVNEKLKQKHTFVRFLRKGITMHAWTEIYGDIVVIAINYKKPMSIVIHNKFVAQSYKENFKILWKLAKE